MPVRLPNLFSLFNRATRRQHVRRFDAAGGGRRGSGFGTFGRTQTEVAGAAHLVRSRARALYANNPHIRNGVDNWVAALVGTGIVPTGDVSLFNDWADDADADGRTDFWGLQADIARSLVIDGEAFIQVLVTDDGLRLRLIPSELADASKTAELADGGYIVNGVEFSASGERVAYWIMPAKPSDVFASYAAPVRIPATEVLHVFKPLGVGQVRGISWLAPVVVPANELDAIVDGLAVGVKVAALHAGFLVDQNGTGEPFEGDLSDVSLEPGTVRRLPAGYDIKFSSPTQAGEVASFLRFNLQMLAAGLGLPEHMLSGDLTNANYSSLRAGLLPFRQRVEQVQYGVLVPQLLNPVWRGVMTIAALTGDVESVPKVEWLPPAWQQVDPEKAAKADAAELAAGLTSRRKLVAARGWAIADLDQEIAEDRAREKTLGLNFEKESAHGENP
ncbi:phage portal protein [Brucella intermedia]|uniref:phage portal protein n=1 Tax=Brucella intermedia TaxID=94625 RepID=UPI002096BF01|nr:phage portal protein [Brucella intermedia]MCO7725788.1 phage portal protein [Brucella intermedia]